MQLFIFILFVQYMKPIVNFLWGKEIKIKIHSFLQRGYLRTKETIVANEIIETTDKHLPNSKPLFTTDGLKFSA
jgi:hypothetical protein